MSIEGDAKLDACLADVVDELTARLDQTAGEHVIFALFIFGDGEPGSRGRVVSNGERPAVEKAVEKPLES